MSDVLFNVEDVAVVDAPMINRLKVLAQASPRQRSRLCLHRQNESLPHEMVIVARGSSYLRPHRHPRGKSESYHIIEGKLQVILFDDTGNPDTCVPLGGSTGAPLYRLSAPRWHMPLICSDWLVYHEVYSGPFHKETDVEYAPWAPEEGSAHSALYLQKIHSYAEA